MAALAALFGCDDPAESLLPDERAALTQLVGDRLEDVAVFEEGEGDKVANLSYAELRGGHIVDLSLQRMDLTTVAPLAALGELERLDVSYNQLTSLDGLGGLGALTDLNAGSNRISSATSLAGLGLTQLSLAENALTDASTVPPLPRLERLNLAGNALGSLSGLPALPALSELIVSDCRLESLAGLGPRPALERLTVQQNQLTTLAGLEGAPALQTLFARHNALTDASALAELSALERADLQHNELTAAPSVAEGVRLELEGNELRLEDPDRWVVAGMDLGPPPSPYVEQLPSPRGATGSVERRCGHLLGDIDCHETLSRLTGFHEVNLGQSSSSPPGGNITVRVGRGKVRLYLPWPTHDAWTMSEATPGSPIETSGQPVRARADQSLGRYALLIESVDGTAEDIEVRFRSGSGD